MDLFGDHFYRIFWLGIGPTTVKFIKYSPLAKWAACFLFSIMSFNTKLTIVAT